MPPVPQLLLPYLGLRSDGSMTLLTGTLAASSSWLLLTFLAANQQSQADERQVVLVTWLHETLFWKDGAKKLSIDFRRIHMIDALSSGLGLDADSLAPVEDALCKALSDCKHRAKDRHTLLVLDGLDLLLAATACRVQGILDMIYGLREMTDHIIITSHADGPLLHANNTPLESSHSALTMSLAHSASLMMSVKELDTGGAEDVTGVLRITTGGDYIEDRREGEATVGKELLYFVAVDGSAKVFERGS